MNMKPQVLQLPRPAAARLSLKFIRTLLAIRTTCLLLPVASASILLEDSSNYPIGDLAGNGLWTNAATPITVVGSDLTYAGLADPPVFALTALGAFRCALHCRGR